MAMQIMIKYRHGGSFDFGSNVAYIGGSFDVEFCDAEDISLEQLKISVKEYGYNNIGMLYYAIPSVGLASGGLKPLNSDQDLAEMIEHALRDRVIEIYANHSVDIPAEVHVPIEGATSIATSPKRNIPMTKRKKLTPKKRLNVKEGQWSVSNPTISPLPIPSKSPLPIPSNSPPHKAAQTYSSDDDDDSVKDENFRIDPTEPLYDDDGEDDELYDEFSARNRSRKGKQIMKTDKNVDESVGGGIDVRVGVSNEDDGGDIDSAESEDIESHKSPVGSDDDELFEIRQKNKKILEEEKGRIAFNVGARLVDDLDSPPPTVVVLPSVPQPEPEPQQFNEANTSSIPIHDTDATINQAHSAEVQMLENLFVGLNVGGPNCRGTIPKAQNWPSFWTNYEGGYQSDQRSSNNEGPLFDSDHEAPETNMKKKKKERVN